MVGPNEVKITKVYTVEAANEFSGNHDATPNLREDGGPNRAMGAFNLRIEAEAGSIVGATGVAYQLVIQPVCLTNPLAVLVNNLNLSLGETFASNWEHQVSEEKFTKSWSIPLPVGLPLQDVVPPFIKQTDQTWQCIVSLVRKTGPHAFNCTQASEHFVLL